MKKVIETPRSREDEREAERRREVLRGQMATAFGDVLAALGNSQAASADKPKAATSRAARPAA
ncbi:MAG: hypothetical protein CL534_01210 [Ahrensia sp.]|nr:hypothetical protein [Ahrensia sp.]